MALVLKLLFAGCVLAPLLAGARNSARAVGAGALCASILFAVLIGVGVDPLALGFSKVDDAMVGIACGVGLRPSR
ncbi:hypothetical protein J7E62_17385 [Variovorax paradoxus]|nr:hypothetical protein [Variovorax paradoxus]